MKEEERGRLDAEWLGPLTTHGETPREEGAPWWWPGDDDAADAAQAVIAALGR